MHLDSNQENFILQDDEVELIQGTSMNKVWPIGGAMGLMNAITNAKTRLMDLDTTKVHDEDSFMKHEQDRQTCLRTLECMTAVALPHVPGFTPEDFNQLTA